MTLPGDVVGQEIGAPRGLLTGVALSRISVWIPYGAKKATRKWPKSLILWRARDDSNVRPLPSEGWLALCVF
ncbi:hypothetical protein ZRA01_38650 [Zoogloea ramigera]|uniref:Uncharacterized protein n=1 Tax=Zoogloea ramigera TaxID=350 RepID=A0A4Y4D0B6_ZOORA|nr:hypothetical protein ZRA01_38650 [Zoogloea ramigera]